MSIPQVSWPKYGESKEYTFYRNWQIYSIKIHTVFLSTYFIEIRQYNTKYKLKRKKIKNIPKCIWSNNWNRVVSAETEKTAHLKRIMLFLQSRTHTTIIFVKTNF